MFTTLPFFQRLLRASGFVEEAARAVQGVGGICLIGSVDPCRERIAEYRAAGLDLPILWPGHGVDTARQLITAFRQ